MSQVECIPATVAAEQQPGVLLKHKHNIRVAAYCRVSTDDEDQQTSYEGQCAYYRKLITEKEDWQFAGIYADEGITGTNRDRRVQFNQMMEDALNGKIDYIITKAVSRFARNTLDTLYCVRQLRLHNPPVGVFFEKENLDSLDPTCELVLTMLSAIAQEESRSTSSNLKWSYQRRFKAGQCSLNSRVLLGYDDEWVINEKQARTVRYIYQRYLEGATTPEIVKELNAKEWLTQNNNKWCRSGIISILTNEKYVGDVILQKYITPDFLTHQKVKNNGEAPQYYVRDHHPAIIDREDWEKVQDIYRERQEQIKAKKEAKAAREANGPVVDETPYNIDPITNLRCGVCGGPLKKAKYVGYLDHQAYGFNYYAYRCTTKFANRNKKGPPSKVEETVMGYLCPSERILQCAVEQSFMELMYQIKRDVAKHGRKAEIWKQFNAEMERIQREEEGTQYSRSRLELVLGQIAETETKLKAIKYSGTGDAQQKAALKQQIKALKQEAALLESELGGAAQMERFFQAFLEMLQKLPEANAAGMKLNVNGLDVDGSLFADRMGNERCAPGNRKITPQWVAQAPDLLTFDKDLYHRFILKGEVKGDKIEFSTNFGVKLTSVGNSRKLKGFFGFRHCNPDGTVDLLTEKWQVAGGKFQKGKRKAS